MIRPGDMVGDFVVEGLIGSGGMGSVYRALQPIIKRRVAIKILGQAWTGHADAVARFMREARAIHRIKHRGVPDVLTFGTLSDGSHYYVMELLEGEDLRTRLKRMGRLPPKLVTRLVSDIASILDAAHQAGIIHRDLKPENVFLAFEGENRDAFEVKLLDFGIAKLAPNHGEDDGVVTNSRSVLGTPAYMSPEQVLGREIDARSDIYSLGVLTFEMLSGSAPFSSNQAKILERKLSIPAPPVSGGHHELARFDEAIAKALAMEPTERQATASQLAKDLAASLDKASIEDLWIGRRAVGIAALSLLTVTGIAYYASVSASPVKPTIESPVAPPKPAVIAPAPVPVPVTRPTLQQKRPIKRIDRAKDEPEIVPDMPVKF